MRKQNLYYAILCSCILIGCSNDSSGSFSDKLPVCGNSAVETGELCDDGNDVGEDGCSADCKTIEDGYICPTPGEACQPKPASNCGNGAINNNEACDDGNDVGGDGCSADCKIIEENYRCEEPGKPCIPMTCGNEVVDEPYEECDDGEYSVEYGGGCGFDCTFTHYCGDHLLDDIDKQNGEECDNGDDNVLRESEEYDVCDINCKRLNYCGDGKIDAGHEVCDDGNSNDDDGCSSKCEYEVGFACSVTGGKTTCTPVACSNGVVDSDSGELCDDGNRSPNDGCSPTCQIEKGWKCTTDELTGMSKCTNSCGDGHIDSDSKEQCEDGNIEEGDGCSASCQVEAGYICSLSETPDSEGRQLSKCVARACGDGFAVGTEECDDGNTVDGDGCNKYCKREADYHCPDGGGECIKDKCGDGLVTGDETCDEGSENKTAGCDNCQIQFGWECIEEGKPCTQTAVCGDGVLQGSEECDDNNTASNDGCSDKCIIEKDYACEGMPSVCTSGICGDGIIQKGEECDDHGVTAGDGCSPVCKKEPIFDCTKDGCKPVCGDGLTLWEAGEECDDGNLINGDGCSSDCKIENGFTCTKFDSSEPPYIELPIVYRDFIKYDEHAVNASATPMTDGYISQALLDTLPDHCKGVNNGYRTSYPPEAGRPSPDFYSYCPDSHCLNSVMPELGANGKPVLSPPDRIQDEPGRSNGETCRHLYTCPEMFQWWYTDVPGINKTVVKKLRLDKKDGSKPTAYAYGNASFLPLENGEAYTNVAGLGEFTSEFQTYFKYQGGEVLTFDGDDDVWVFFNGKLGVDVGGIHPRWERSVTLDTESAAEKFDMYPGGIYSLNMFHAERCLGGSSFRLTLAGFVNMGTSECSAICGDGIVTGGEECDIKDHVDDETSQFAGCRKCKRVPYCGNDVVETGEGCDEKQPWCDRCQIKTCGNKQLDEHETCDLDKDGNVIFADGKGGADLQCSHCRIVGCGDGIVDEGEDCDDNNTVNNDACPNTCVTPYCGDKIVQEWLGEVCDDGINDGAYGHCGLGCAYQAPRCGDGVVDKYSGEACDDGINDGSYNTCNPDCTMAPHCGDGIVQEGFEVCDEGENNGVACPFNCLNSDN